MKTFFIAILTFLLCNMMHVVLSHSLNMLHLKKVGLIPILGVGLTPTSEKSKTNSNFKLLFAC